MFYFFLAIISVTSAYNATLVGKAGPYCWTDGPGSSAFSDCLDACPKPESGATCDNEISGVNSYWCCHEPLPGCYSNQNDAKSHCSTGKVSKLDDYVYCCTMEDCCHSSDGNCNAGDVCCNSGCDDPTHCTYSQSTCGGAYGEKHSCMWDDNNEICVVGNV